MDMFPTKKGNASLSNKDEDIDNILMEGCDKITKDVRPLSIHMTASFVQNLLSVNVKAVDTKEANEKHLEMFYEMIYYIPFNVKGKRYRYEMTTYKDPTFKTIKHRYQIETALDEMPDTGGVTKEEWKNFIKQLVYTKDNRPMKLPEPLPFSDEIEGDFVEEDFDVESYKKEIEKNLVDS